MPRGTPTNPFVKRNSPGGCRRLTPTGTSVLQPTRCLEASRHRVGCRTLVPVGVSRRQPPGEFLFTKGFVGVPRGIQCDGKHVVRVTVGGVAPQSFAQPVDRRLRV